MAEFRSELYTCLLRGATLCSSYATLCTDGPVRTLVDLALAPEHRRGHGALYSGINHGRINVARLRRALTGVPLPRASTVGSFWRWTSRRGCGRTPTPPRTVPSATPSAAAWASTSWCPAGRVVRRGALETGRTSWTALLDAIRLEPGTDLAAVTASQVRDVVERLVEAGQWQAGAPNVLVVLDAGYDAPRIAHLLSALPVEVMGRLRSDRVMRKPVPVP
ncbi:transposase [Streptomyces erythrochromogenes]|uniref:transposase n=1 Tax=Streptomyces erythrochromogenes TaxID=285574 RepID=UPI0036CEE17D